MKNNKKGYIVEKILDIVSAIAHEKGLKQENVLQALKTAFIQTAKHVVDKTYTFDVDIDDKTKKLHLYRTIVVVANDDERLQDQEIAGGFISLEEAKTLDEDAELDDQLQIDYNLEDYGRTAAGRLHNEIEFHVQRLVENELYEKYHSKVGTVVSGRVTLVDSEQNTFIEVDEVRAKLPMKNRIKGEKFVVGDVVKALVRRVDINKANGIQIELSRTSPKFLEQLLRMEVPEIDDEIVVIEKSARIPGERAKVALISTNPRIDPIGATVGVKGVRINAVSQELCGENIDCLEYTAIPELFLARVMSPAIISHIEIVDNKKAIITLPSDQKSKAIGKSGINIRLASMISGLEIELVEQEGSSTEEKDGVDALQALFN